MKVNSLCSFGLITVVLGVTAYLQGGWTIETVDPNGNTYMTSGVLDPSGNPGICYTDWVGNGILRYASRDRDSSVWQYQTVDSSEGWWPSLAFDGNGRPHIAYFGRDTGHVNYAAWNGTSWDITREIANTTGSRLSLALDSNGNPWISYRSSGLCLTHWNGTSWIDELIDSDTGAGWDSSLALDGNDGYHISYSASAGELRYADPNGLHTLATGMQIRTFSSIAITMAGESRIAYVANQSGGLKYAAWNGTVWIVEPIDSLAGNEVSLALDSSDMPRISYFEMADFDLKYAAWNGSSWDFQVVDREGNVGGGSSLALDSQGDPWISYIDGTNLNLAYLPEPATLSLLALGGLAVTRRRSR